jgi:hypothetical protein
MAKPLQVHLTQDQRCAVIDFGSLAIRVPAKDIPDLVRQLAAVMPARRKLSQGRCLRYTVRRKISV